MPKEVFPTTAKVTVTRVPITAPPPAMVVRLYHADGSTLDVFPVDAKEIVAGGEYSYDPPTSSISSGEGLSEPEALDFHAMTKAELQVYAENHGIQVTAAMTKAEQIEALHQGGK